jgi:hypothetical protein
VRNASMIYLIYLRVTRARLWIKVGNWPTTGDDRSHSRMHGCEKPEKWALMRLEAKGRWLALRHLSSLGIRGASPALH